MRKIIAKRLAESLFTAPHYNLTIEVTMDDAMKSRTIINSIPDTKVSFNDMVIKACAMALKTSKGKLSVERRCNYNQSSC
jgi:pyruvate dehydrogenase E2 component (dihydrolipoamide acetyltransferase)